MKKVLLVCCCALFLFCGCETKINQGSENSAISFREGLRRHLQALCSEKMGGREGGARGEALAGLYLADFLQEKGLKPAGDEGTYFQAFSLGTYQPVLVNQRMKFLLVNSGVKTESENVLAILEGKSKEIIVVSAHYDHLGIINGELYSGANDNASGVAVGLEIAHALAGKKPEKTILFAFWGAEEKGLLGSGYFCEHPTVPLEQICCIINLDSIGNLQSDKQLLGWKSVENKGSQEIIENLQQKGWQLTWEKQSVHSSDHVSFAKKGIGGFTLLSPAWLAKNHTTEDQIDRINIAYLEELTWSLVGVLK